MMIRTFLSNYVHRIIVEFRDTCKSCTRGLITKELTYNWSVVEGILGEIADDFEIHGQSEEWFCEKSQLVWNVIHEAGSAVDTASDEDRRKLYELCDWVDCHNDVTEYTLNCQNKGDGPLLAVLVLTAALERALGNVYMTRNQPVPFLLRDLLKTSELSCIFGKVPIVFTQLLLGCPKGFNLRNVVWHGFVSPGELHPHLVSALTVLIASLGKCLQDYQMVPKRPQFSSFESFKEELNDVFPDILSFSDDVQNMIETSPFIPENHKILWNKSYYLLQAKRYGYSLVLIMPQLEHCLRVLYCQVNKCPDRLLTAESTVFYTTLDEILAPSQSAVVCNGLLMLLLDVTSSLSGPRVRDRISHGEIDLSLVPHWLVNVVFCAALAIAHSNHRDLKDKEEHCNIRLCVCLQEAVSRYHSRFHILASLRQQLASLLDQWPSWQQCSQPADVSIQPVSCQVICALDQLMFPGGCDTSEKLNKVKESLESCELSTLHRPKPELELAAALSSVAARVAQTAVKVSHAAASRRRLWCDRELRSRGRATALRMWSVLPDVWTALMCVVAIVALCYRQLPHLTSRGKSVFRLVKTLTKTVENTVTLCDVDKNRWTEAHQMLSILASMCLQFFTDNADLVNKVK